MAYNGFNRSLSGTPAGGTSTVVVRDSSGNSAANNFISGSTNTTSASGTTVLTSASTRVQVLQGTQNQTYQLPNATTLAIGATFEFNNNSTGILTVVDAASGAVCTAPSGGYARVIALAVSTSAGAWDKHFLISANGSYGTAGQTVTGFLTATGACSANNFIPGYTTTATTGGTTTLTVSSTEQQYFTGTSTQTVVMPVTSTLVLGQAYTIVNNSTQAVTVQSSGGNTIQVMAADSSLRLVVINTGVTTAAGWNSTYSFDTTGVQGPGSSTDRAISTWNGTSGSALFNNSTTNIDSTGRITNSAQPSFLAYLANAATDVTGDGTAYVIVFDTSLVDRGSNFNTSTGVFTAPVTGIYQFNASILAQQATAAMATGTALITTARNYIMNNNSVAVVGNNGLNFSLTVPMTAGDTASVRVTFSGSTKTVDIYGAAGDARTTFSGFLVC